jgi:hypothetical protein
VKHLASERAYELRSALLEMVIRYGDSMQRYGMATGGTFDGKSWEHWRRATRRQFAAIQRLAYALRDVEVTR